MKALLSDFLLLMMVISVCGSLLLFGMKGMHRIFRVTAGQASLGYKLVGIFHFVSLIILLVILVKSAAAKFVPLTGRDFGGYWVYALPVAYRYYDHYKELDWLPYAAAVWAAGMGTVFFLCDVMSRRRLRMLKKISTVCTECGTEALVGRIAGEYHIKSRLQIYRTDVIGTPFVTGIIRPVIFLPQRDFSQGDLEFILRHELIHYRKGDILFRQFLIYLKSFYWFDPFIYLFARNLCDSCEMACDELVLRHSDQEKRWKYARCIAGFTDNDKVSGYGVGLSSGHIVEKRLAAIAAMGKKEKKHTRTFGVSICAGALFFACVFLAVTGFMGIRTGVAEMIGNLYITPV